MKFIAVLALSVTLAACGNVAPNAPVLNAIESATDANPATAAINAIRAGKGQRALTYSAQLAAIAQGHANDMAAKNYFSHEGADGSTPAIRAKRGGYRYCFVAENIAWGQPDLASVMATWRGSKGHYANMTHKKARSFGLARAPGNIWVMVLAAPRGGC